MEIYENPWKYNENPQRQEASLESSKDLYSGSRLPLTGLSIHAPCPESMKIYKNR